MRSSRQGLCVLFALITLAACSSSHTQHDATTVAAMGATPTDTSPDAGFVRDMSVHHAQAVALSEAIRDRTADPELRLLATDIALGQQNQIGRMTGWLDQWGLQVSSTNAPMAWMSGHESMSDMTGTTDTTGTTTDTTVTSIALMPGMATRPQVTALGTLPIAEAEVSFLQLMIAHHLGGVQMAEAILELSDRPEVVRLAQSIVDGQTGEIKYMTEMLAKRGATP